MGGGGGGTFRTLNQPWNVHLIIPRNPPGLFVLQHRFTSPNIPCINHYFITPHNWQEAWTTSVSRPLHWHVHASVCVGMCVCVCKNKIKKKLSSLTHHSCPAEILSFSGTVSLLFSDIFFLSAEILEEARRDRSHVRILPDRKRKWLMLFFRKHHQRQTHEVKVSHIFCLSLVCFWKDDLVLKTAGVQFIGRNKVSFN